MGKEGEVSIPKPVRGSASSDLFTPVQGISLTCPYCREALSKNKIVRCSVCGTGHHLACWKDHGKCSVYNCTGTSELISVSRKQFFLLATTMLLLLLIVGGWFFYPKTVPVPEGPELQVNIYTDFQYVNQGWPFGLSVGQTRLPALSEDPQESLKAEPRYHDAHPLYGYFALTNASDWRYSFAIDRVEWALYVDKNNNEDLTDDGPPAFNQGTGVLASLLSLQLELIAPNGSVMKQPYDLWFWYNEKDQNAYFYPRCHYAGQLQINGKMYKAIAYQQFQHLGLSRESGIWIDLNEDEKLDQTEHFFEGSLIHIPASSKTVRLKLAYP